ncbi:MAG: DUF2889 domain-containing protein [Firmicutes bacterium]|nr:DUF2889 domain-containing protein [Bacillota bacterium]
MLKILKQGSYISRVERVGENEAYSDASLLSTDYECAVHIRFNVVTYEILEASWGIHRAPDMSRRGQGSAPQLIGESGYIFDQKNSAAVLPDYSVPAESRGDGVTGEWKIIRELFLEALRGAFQAEFFLFRERGYESTEQFEGAWQDGRGTYCRPYTVAMPTPDQWVRSRDAKEHVRDNCIYSKYKNFTFMDAGKDEAGAELVYALGTYSDTLHEMSGEMTFRRGDGVITDFDINVVRVPFPSCSDLDHTHAEDFVGKDIRAIKKREVGKILGGALGCFHFVDIVADLTEMSRDI